MRDVFLSEKGSFGPVAFGSMRRRLELSTSRTVTTGSGNLLLGRLIGVVVDPGAITITLGSGDDWLVWPWKISSVV